MKQHINANNIPNNHIEKDHSYEQFEHAYRTAYSSYLKNPGKKFGEVEDSVAVEYEQGKPDSALRETRCVPK